MAKMTIEGVVYEGTPEELRELVTLFSGIDKEADKTPKPIAGLITHEGVDYTLVDRKAQAGDVVVFTEGKGSCLYENNVPHEVIDGVQVESSKGWTTHDVYREKYNRTESNVLVYEKVEKETPKEYPQKGDIVRATGDHTPYVKRGELGVVLEGDETDRPYTKFKHAVPKYAPVEVVVREQYRVS